MLKKILILMGILVVLVGLLVMTVREQTESPVIQKTELSEEPAMEEADDEEIPAEFEDNLDQAFEDLEAIDLLRTP